MKTWLLGAAVAVLSLAMIVPADVEAKRLGGGKSLGMQRDMPARTAPDAPAGKPATPAQASPTAPAGATAAAGAAAAPAKRSWMGPLAGLAAGLGIAALLSHFGLGEGFANFLMLALLALAAVFVVRWIMRRMSPAAATPQGMERSSGAAGGAQVAWPSPGGSSTGATSAAPLAPVAESASTGAAALPAAQDPVVLGEALAPARPAVAKAFVPASFDAEAFQRAAKMIFIRLQAANDTADLDDIRSFTTPEMFAELRMDLQDRNDAQQHTDVLKVDAEVLDVAQEDERQIVSVRYTGQLREAAGEAPIDFSEVWHLVKPVDDSRAWAIAGIEQTGR
jgi:predicted lipid-binding transport protein (Tim44 family)